MTHPIVSAWHQAAMSSLPMSLEIWDAHTHTGSSDPDGFTNDPKRLLAALDAVGHAGAVVAPSADPNGYRAQNARVLAEGAESNGRIVPYLRVDPRIKDIARDVVTDLQRGYRGIKMHPRSEGFAVSHPGVRAVATVAAANRVPLLIHAGRGMPALGEAVVDLLDAIPDLTIILAHAGISDQSWIGPESRTRPGLMFDTAWWNAADLLGLLGEVDASQILYASDMPYWHPAMSTTLTARCVIQAGISGEGLRAIFGGNLLRVLAGSSSTAPLGRGVSGMVDPGLLRIASNLYAAIGSARAGKADVESIELALRAGEVASTPLAQLLDAIRRTLGEVLEHPDHHPLEQHDLLLLACCAALTPIAPVPSL